MHRTLTPRLFAVAAAAAVVLAYLRVASLPPPTTPSPTYTWGTAVTEVVADIEATVVGLRQEFEQQKATYTKMYDDTRALQEKLTSTTGVNR